MDFKKIGKALIYPHIAIMLSLILVSTLFLVFSMAFLDSASVVSIASYLLAAYTLTVWCLRLPSLIGRFNNFRNENRYLRIWRNDINLRVNVSLYGTLIWNVAYAFLQLGMGVSHKSFWFYSLAGYYISLAVMRFFLVRYTSRHKAGEYIIEELRKYRVCGIVFLLMNLALSLMVFFMVYWNRSFRHHEITTIALAAYTFTSLTFAIINMVRYKKYNSPVYSASKAISLASALVSVLTLEATMLTTFGSETMGLSERRILLGASGGAISAFIIVMAVYMIATGTKKLKQLRTDEE